MFEKRLASLIILAALVFVPACTLQPAGGGTTAAPDVAQQTQVAEMVASTLTAVAQTSNNATSTQQALASSTPSSTLTPQLSPTQTFTPTPTVPMVTVSVNTNCRTGPNTAYDILGVLKVGEKAEVVGRSTIFNTMIIKLPSNPAVTCWLWGQNATVTGDPSVLPLFPVPPTPTPKYTATPEMDFTLSYYSVSYCAGVYRIRFKLTNTGGRILESNRVTVTDKVTSTTTKIVYDDFPYYSSSCSQSADQNLETGETGFTSSDGFTSNPAGDSLTATIFACSKDGLGGFCMEKTISFTP